MSTITVTSKKSYQQIIASPMDIYIRRSDAEDLDDTHDKSFINLGYTKRGSTSVNITPVIVDIDCGQHAIKYEVKISTVLAQAHSDIMTIVKNMKTRENVDLLFYREAFSTDNFITRGMSMYVDGSVAISAHENRGIPVTFTGHFSNIDEIFEPSLQTINIPIEYFLFRNTNIISGLPVFTKNDYLGTNYITTTIGERSGYFDDSSTDISQLGFTLQSTLFRLSAAVTITSLSGREIGLALCGDTYAHWFAIHNGTCKCYKVRLSDGYTSLQATYNLIHNTASESFTLMIEVNGTTAKVYDDSTLIGTYTLSVTDCYIGLVIKNNNGAGTEDNRLSLLNYTSDLFLPNYLMADEFEHFTEVVYADVEPEVRQ